MALSMAKKPEILRRLDFLLQQAPSLTLGIRAYGGMTGLVTISIAIGLSNWSSAVLEATPIDLSNDAPTQVASTDETARNATSNFESVVQEQRDIEPRDEGAEPIDARPNAVSQGESKPTSRRPVAMSKKLASAPP